MYNFFFFLLLLRNTPCVATVICVIFGEVGWGLLWKHLVVRKNGEKRPAGMLVRGAGMWGWLHGFTSGHCNIDALLCFYPAVSSSGISFPGFLHRKNLCFFCVCSLCLFGSSRISVLSLCCPHPDLCGLRPAQTWCDQQRCGYRNQSLDVWMNKVLQVKLSSGPSNNTIPELNSNRRTSLTIS